ncbi:hypothetical protein [Confluentibacter citreus]|uniref:hypothetical protein n=1 Tax=Confluentibacter citreus TaxID=2007307 RepID=UPI000C2954B7|nr:hypothetical protein [Confluentibacter citreus]
MSFGKSSPPNTQLSIQITRCQQAEKISEYKYGDRTYKLTNGNYDLELPDDIKVPESVFKYYGNTNFSIDAIINNLPKETNNLQNTYDSEIKDTYLDYKIEGISDT